MSSPTRQILPCVKFKMGPLVDLLFESTVKMNYSPIFAKLALQQRALCESSLSHTLCYSGIPPFWTPWCQKTVPIRAVSLVQVQVSTSKYQVKFMKEQPQRAIHSLFISVGIIIVIRCLCRK